MEAVSEQLANFAINNNSVLQTRASDLGPQRSQELAKDLMKLPLDTFKSSFGKEYEAFVSRQAPPPPAPQPQPGQPPQPAPAPQPNPVPEPVIAQNPASPANPSAAEPVSWFAAPANKPVEFPTAIENMDQALLTFRSAGFQVENPNDLIGIAQNVSQWKAEMPTLQNAKNQLDATLAFYESLPTELKEANYKFLQSMTGEAPADSWRSVFTNAGTIDFTLPFDKQELSNVVKTFLTEEQQNELSLLEESDPSSYDMRVATLKDRYEGKREKVLATKEIEAHQGQIKQAEYARNVEVAQGRLRSSLPGFPDTEVQKVTGMIKNANEVVAMFFDEKGMPKPDALERLALARGGVEQLKVMEAQLSKRIESEVLQRYKIQLPTAPVVTGNAGNPKPLPGQEQRLSPQEQKAYDDYNRMLHGSKDPYASKPQPK